MGRRKKILLVCYGGGHVQMLLPLARALRDSDWAEPVVLGLTAAAAPIRDAGLPLLQFKDFLRAEDAAARTWGQRLLREMTEPTIDPEESIAYLGLSFHELVLELAESEALRRYRERGRHAFLPTRALERVMTRVRAHVLVSTNSPRAEHAAFLAARKLGVPSVCVIDSFVQEEAQRLGALLAMPTGSVC